MNRNEFGLTKAFTSAAAIPPRRIATFGANEGEVQVATSPTGAPFVGVTSVVGAVSGGERIDIYLDGIRTLEAGGAFSQGVDLTTDAVGRVVAAAPAANTTVRIIGQAIGLSTGIGQLVDVRIAPGPLSRST